MDAGGVSGKPVTVVTGAGGSDESIVGLGTVTGDGAAVVGVVVVGAVVGGAGVTAGDPLKPLTPYSPTPNPASLGTAEALVK